MELKDKQIQQIIAQQAYLEEVADDWYDAYANHLTITEWNKKWIWDKLNIPLNTDERR